MISQLDLIVLIIFYSEKSSELLLCPSATNTDQSSHLSIPLLYNFYLIPAHKVSVHFYIRGLPVDYWPMWSFKECKLIVQELEDWDPDFNRIPMKKIAKKGGKKSGMAAKNWSESHSGGEGQ